MPMGQATDKPANAGDAVESISASTHGFCEAIRHKQETMSAVERLCVHVSRTLVCLSKEDDQGFHTFVRERMVWKDDTPSATVTAQSISALQALAGTISGMQSRTPESPNLVFQSLPDQSKESEPEELLQRIVILLEKQVQYLGEFKHENNDFGELNPFTSAHVLGALSTTEKLVSPACWESLFGIIWALERKYPQYKRQSGVSMPHSQPNAFITSLCIDAIELLFETLKRRWDRLNRLVGLIERLGKHEKTNSPGSVLASRWFNHRSQFLFSQIVQCVSEGSRDAAAKNLFHQWEQNLRTSFKVGVTTVDAVRTAFASAWNYSSEIHNDIEKKLKSYIDKLIARSELINKASEYFSGETNEHISDYSNYPTGLIDERYMPKDAIAIGVRKKLFEEYWRDHANAAGTAKKDCTELQEFLVGVFGYYGRAASTKDGDTFLTTMKEVATKFTEQTDWLRDRTAVSFEWCEAVMNHQLSLARSNRLGEFDVAELVHAARVVTRSGRVKDASVILEAISVACSVQYPDGKWPCTQPFFWRSTGLAAFPQSAEVGWALVSIMETLTATPERYGLSQIQVLKAMETAEKSLESFLGWLIANVQSYRVPDLLKSEPFDWVIGWSSDRTPEQGLVHTWATANVIEFLVQFRHYLQEQINTILRVQFTSYHPSDLGSMDKFDPPNLLEDNYDLRIGTAIWRDLQLHRTRAMAKNHRLLYANMEMPRMWSAILAGPPGSAKTYLAKCIAGELKWPLIALSPSDFLSAGEAGLESRAREIFDSLRSGSQIVIFFDEIDELILDRAEQQRGSGGRSVFSFLTPSFLTKLQDLRDAAPRKSLIFLIGTNYSDRIDPAAKRSGRIDKEIVVVYPDEASREALLLNFIQNDIRRHFGRQRSTDAGAAIEKFFNHEGGKHTKALAKATFMLSLPGIKRLCSEINAKFVDGESEDFWTWLDLETEKIYRRTSDLGRQEVDLNLYENRAGAAKEWALMLDLIPDSDQPAKIEQYRNSFKLKDWNFHRQQIRNAVASSETRWLASDSDTGKCWDKQFPSTEAPAVD
jgi:hypothetical protein